MDYDVAIVGGGPVGLSFALSLRDSGLKTVVIEKQSRQQLAKPENDGREIALSHLSQRLMQQHGSWQRINASHISPLKRAEVVDGDSPYTLTFEPTDKDVVPLGFLISNHVLREAIFAEFSGSSELMLLDQTTVTNITTDETGGNIELDTGQQLKVNLVVAADTRFSPSRRQMGIAVDSHDFGRSAILCCMTHEKPHQHTAVECFLYGGTLAVLPMNGKTCSVVITVESNEAKRLLAANDRTFTDYVEERLGGRLGKMQQLGERKHYPLVGVHANRFYSKRFVLIGDAAVGMHPVTAHGFNLGLSGQDVLAREIRSCQARLTEFWSEAVLKRYQHQHMLTTRPLYLGTNSLVALFTDDRLPARVLRKAMLRISNHLPPVKWAIRQKLMSKQHPFFIPPFTLNE